MLVKKTRNVIFLLLSRMMTIYAATLQLQSIQPLLQTQSSLQQQLLALQQLQLIQKLNALQAPKLTQSRPLLILLPKMHANTENLYKNLEKVNIQEDHVKKSTFEDGDTDSIVIDAEREQQTENGQKAILLIPNDPRFSIGGFISSIPFLPIEINVPDSISWVYNGISSIISGIGQRFRPQNTDEMEDMGQGGQDLRVNLPHIRQVMPIIVMPMGQALQL